PALAPLPTPALPTGRVLASVPGTVSSARTDRSMSSEVRAPSVKRPSAPRSASAARSTAARTTAAGSGSGAGTGAGEGGGGGGGVGSDSVAGVAPGAGVASGAGSGDVTGTDAGPGGGPAATAVAGSGAGGAASRYAVSPASVSCSYSSLVGTVMPCRSCSQRTSSTRMIESRPSAVSESWSPISSGGRPSAAATRSRTVSAPGAV